MANDKYRVIAENTSVLGHRKGEDFSFGEEEANYNVEALLAGKIIERVEASKKEKEEA